VLSLHWLRAIAALGVVLYHLESGVKGYQGERPTAELFSAGGLGVLLFFVLSGFVIAMAAVQRPRSGRAFLLGRVARLYPAYLVTAGLFVLALLLIPGGALNHAPEISWERMLRTLVFDFGQMGGYVYVGWTLFYELCFYLAFALVVARFAALHRTAWFQTALSTSLLICAALGMVRSGSFLLGMALFLLLDGSSQASARARLTLAAGVLAFGLRSPEALACGALLVLLVLLECRWRFNFAVAPVLQLGDDSYSIYLVQVLTISASLKLARLLSGGTTDGFAPLALALGVFSTVLAGMAMRRWIERPGTSLTLRWGERLLGGGAGREAGRRG